MEFVEPDGSLFNIDVDVTPPSIPVWNDGPKDFNGSNKKKRQHLEKHRPLLWRTEWQKTEDMTEAAGDNDGLYRPVRLRFANGQDVWVEQVPNQINHYIHSSYFPI